MSDFENNDEPQAPIDPIQAAIDAIQYGDSYDAAQKLKAAIEQEQNLKRERDAMAQADRDANQAGADLERRRPDLAKDRRIRAAIIQDAIDRQGQELANAGVDYADWAKTLGRPVTDADVQLRHKYLRSIKWPKISAPATILEQSEDAWHELTGRPKPTRGDPSREIQNRRAENRRLRGLPAESAGGLSAAERAVGSDIAPFEFAPGTTEAELTARQAGFGDGASSADLSRRQSAFQKMQFERRRLRGGDYESLSREEKQA